MRYLRLIGAFFLLYCFCSAKKMSQSSSVWKPGIIPAKYHQLRHPRPSELFSAETPKLDLPKSTEQRRKRKRSRTRMGRRFIGKPRSSDRKTMSSPTTALTLLRNNSIYNPPQNYDDTNNQFIHSNFEVTKNELSDELEREVFDNFSSNSRRARRSEANLATNITQKVIKNDIKKQTNIQLHSRQEVDSRKGSKTGNIVFEARSNKSRILTLEIAPKGSTAPAKQFEIVQYTTTDQLLPSTEVGRETSLMGAKRTSDNTKRKIAVQNIDKNSLRRRHAHREGYLTLEELTADLLKDMPNSARPLTNYIDDFTKRRKRKRKRKRRREGKVFRNRWKTPRLPQIHMDYEFPEGFGFHSRMSANQSESYHPVDHSLAESPQEKYKRRYVSRQQMNLKRNRSDEANLNENGLILRVRKYRHRSIQPHRFVLNMEPQSRANKSNRSEEIVAMTASNVIVPIIRKNGLEVLKRSSNVNAKQGEMIEFDKGPAAGNDNLTLSNVGSERAVAEVQGMLSHDEKNGESHKNISEIKEYTAADSTLESAYDITVPKVAGISSSKSRVGTGETNSKYSMKIPETTANFSEKSPRFVQLPMSTNVDQTIPKLSGIISPKSVIGTGETISKSSLKVPKTASDFIEKPTSFIPVPASTNVDQAVPKVFGTISSKSGVATRESVLESAMKVSETAVNSVEKPSSLPVSASGSVKQAVPMVADVVNTDKQVDAPHSISGFTGFVKSPTTTTKKDDETAAIENVGAVHSKFHSEVSGGTNSENQAAEHEKIDAAHLNSKPINAVSGGSNSEMQAVERNIDAAHSNSKFPERLYRGTNSGNQAIGMLPSHHKTKNAGGGAGLMATPSQLSPLPKTNSNPIRELGTEETGGMSEEKEINAGHSISKSADMLNRPNAASASSAVEKTSSASNEEDAELKKGISTGKSGFAALGGPPNRPPVATKKPRRTSPRKLHSLAIPMNNKSEKKIGLSKATTLDKQKLTDARQSVTTKKNKSNKTKSKRKQKRKHLSSESVKHIIQEVSKNIQSKLDSSAVEPQITSSQRLPIWGQWGVCSVSCGTGIRVRHRLCSRLVKADYINCRQQSSDTDGCRMETCLAASNHAYRPWGKWSYCSVSCGRGTKVRSRRCKVKSLCTRGKFDSEVITCQIQRNCPKESRGGTTSDAEWAQWLAWSVCSASCAPAIRFRSRICHEAGHGACQGPSVETKECKLHPCQDTMDMSGHWSFWTLWSACSVRCGLGQMRRSRSCREMEDSTNVLCPGDSIESKMCIKQSCSKPKNSIKHTFIVGTIARLTCPRDGKKKRQGVASLIWLTPQSMQVHMGTTSKHYSISGTDLLINDVKEVHTGMYHCMITNKDGTSGTGDATLTVISCDDFPCRNGGTCTVNHDRGDRGIKIQCVCRQGYYGFYCQKITLIERARRDLLVPILLAFLIILLLILLLSCLTRKIRALHERDESVETTVYPYPLMSVGERLKEEGKLIANISSPTRTDGLPPSRWNTRTPPYLADFTSTSKPEWQTEIHTYSPLPEQRKSLEAIGSLPEKMPDVSSSAPLLMDYKRERKRNAEVTEVALPLLVKDVNLQKL